MRPEHMTPMERDLPSGRLQRRKEHLVSEVRAWDRTIQRRRRRLALILVPAALVVLVATGFTTYALVREPTHLESVGCYERASLDANVAVVSADERAPTDICGEVWRTGGFGEEGASPQLTACVLPTGAVGVFPGTVSTTCSELGLAELPASYAAEKTGFAGLRAAIVAKLGEPPSGSSRGGPQCVGEDDARLFVSRELEVWGYSDWEIEVVGDFTATRPCADVSFDTGGKTVILAPGLRE
jgi:hypothetical protein